MSRRNKHKNNVQFITDDMAVLGEHGIIVSMGEPPAIPAKTPKPEKKGEGGNTDVAVWGENNDYPQQIIEKVKADTELPPLLDWKGRVLQGREVVAVNMVWNEDKKDFDVVRINDPEINDFLNSRMFKRYWREACVDFSWFAIPFPDLIKNTAGNKIAYLGTLDASWCRWNKQDEKGTITKCYVSSNWPDVKTDDPTTLEIDVVDPYDPTLVETLKGQTATKRFVFPAFYPTPGNAYYPMAPYASFLFSEWYKIKQMIPKWKVKMMEKVLSAKFTLQIPFGYWKKNHSKWDTMTPEERLAIKQAKVKEINDRLTGIENVGDTILTEVGYDDNGKEIPGFKIVPIDNPFKDGQHLEDSREASEHLMRGLNTDPTLVGDGPGKKIGGGSGSDKRIAFNIQVALLQPYREVILEPLYFIAEYNGWKEKYANIRFKVLEIELETLDKAHSTSKETNPVTPDNGTA